MAYGLQVWDDNGNLILDVTDRFTRVLGEFQTGETNGTISDPNLATGTPWYVMRDLSAFEILNDASCNVIISSNSLSWAFGSSGTKRNKIIVYGVY